LNPPTKTSSIQSWLDTLPADFDPTLSRVPSHRRRGSLGVGAVTQTGVRLEGTIGEGGMATVHAGVQMSLDRVVAIKVRKTDLDANTLDILHEAWLTSALEHPNIVPIYDLSLDEAGEPMVVMRRIEGTEWGALFQKPDVVCRDFGVADAMEWHLRVFLQVCNAVHYAHSMGVVHRDIKPANIMVGVHGQVYLLDWGIAIGRTGPLAAKLKKFSADSEPAGTPSYLAPEMLSGEAECIDERTDVYLLAATLYDLLTGHPPHRGANLEEVLNSVTDAAVVIPDDLPCELQSILTRCLAEDPEDRFATVDQLRRSVDTYLSHRSSYKLELLAGEHLETLQEAFDTHKLDNSLGRVKLYKLYSMCRAEYRAALQLWEQNPSALAGLLTATQAMIAGEIEHGTPRAATALLSELDDPPDDLVRQVEKAQHAEGLEHDDMRDMASKARKWRSAEGARLRVITVMLFGFSFGIYSIYALRISFAVSLAVDVIGLIGLAIYWAITRKLGVLNAFNSRAIAILGIVFVIQMLRKILAPALDIPSDQVMTYDGLVFACVLSAAAASFEAKLWPASVFYFATHIFALAYPADAGLAYGLSHMVLGLNTGWIWWPRGRVGTSIEAGPVDASASSPSEELEESLHDPS
jgi:serine/threonine-protein kinase